MPLEVEEQAVILFAGVKGFIDRVAVEDVIAFEAAWLEHIKTSHPDILAEIKSTTEISSGLDDKLMKVCDEFTSGFSA